MSSKIKSKKAMKNKSDLMINEVSESQQREIKAHKSDKHIFYDNYRLAERIGSGSFGEVYLGVSLISKKKIAMKTEACERRKSKGRRKRRTKLEIEYEIYRTLHNKGVKNIPKIYNFTTTPKFHIMHMRLLGKSLDILFKRYNYKFDMGTTLKLGYEMVCIMQSLHKAGVIHRDIKPNNFMTGRKNKKRLYVMDFGLSKVYIKGNRHIKHCSGRKVMGTPRYVGINIHMGHEPSRRDDMESIGYMLVYFLKGKLPWQGLKKDKKATQVEKIMEVKMSTSIEKLCEDLPVCFQKYLEHVKELEFRDTPDYEYLKKLFIKAGKKEKIKLRYIWENPDDDDYVLSESELVSDE